MGKTTLYHPISLHVIRGALEYCGVKLSRLTQKSSSMADETATYHAVILRTTRSLKQATLPDIAKELQGCFMQDVTVSKIFCTYNLKTSKMDLTAVLYVDIHELTPIEEEIQRIKEKHDV